MAHPVEAHAAVYSLKDWAAIFGMVIAVGGAVLSGWTYWLQGKVKSITTLWNKWDVFQKEYGEHRLEDAKEFATKKEVARAVERLEDKIDRSEEKIEGAITNLSAKVDVLLQRPGGGRSGAA